MPTLIEAVENVVAEVMQLRIEVGMLRTRTMSHSQAKLAVELFDGEYIGQDAEELWDWAISEAHKTDGKESSL